MANKLLTMLLSMNIKQPHKMDPLRSAAIGVLLVFCIASINCYAQQASVVFRTTSIDGSERLSTEELKMRTSGELSGIYARETLPAEQFPGGNWGELTNGVRLSIRVCDTNLISNTNSVVGMPLHIAILLRNEGDSVLRYVSAHWVNYPFFLTLTCNGTRLTPLIPPLKEGPHEGSLFGRSVSPCSQHREMLRLDKIYDLSRPGDYEVSAEFKKKAWSAKSGVARFRLTEDSKTEQKADPNSRPPEPEVPGADS
jgi:hypothetical protein